MDNIVAEDPHECATKGCDTYVCVTSQFLLFYLHKSLGLGCPRQ